MRAAIAATLAAQVFLVDRAASASDGPTSPTLVRRWVYRLEASDFSITAPALKGVEVSLIEQGRRRHRDGEIVDFAVERDGKRLGADDLKRIGLGERPPGAVFFAKPSLLVQILRHPGGSRVTLFDGSAASVTKALEGPLLARWRLSDERKRAPRASRIPPDRPYSFGRKVGEWPSVCQAYAHPSPESGDYYEWERCYAHGVGITFMKYLSVWGNYTLELVRPPPP